MNFDDYQAAAKKTAIYPDDTKVLYPALGLASETGEVAGKFADAMVDTLKMADHAGRVAGKVKKVLRDTNGLVTDERQQELAKEIGDVLWYVAALASDLQLNLGDIARANIAKLADRQERGKLKGDGDNR